MTLGRRPKRPNINNNMALDFFAGSKKGEKGAKRPNINNNMALDFFAGSKKGEKGAVISSVLAVAIVIASSVVVINVITPMIEEGNAYNQLNKAKQVASSLDMLIKELSVEAPGSKRAVRIEADFGSFEVIGKEDRIKFHLSTPQEIFEPGTVVREAGYVMSSGPSMKAYDNGTDFILENDAVMFAVRKLGSPSGWVSVNTSSMVTKISNKRVNVNATPVTSAILIGDDPNTSVGTGYTELTKSGLALTGSSVHIFVNSTAGLLYDALFSLSSAQDFVELEVKNIRTAG